MSDLSVSERRIKPIQDAIESENWKQALQLCEKWQKKGERSDRFQAIKAFVLVKQHDTALSSRGVAETSSLCSRTPAITDIDALHQIQDSLNQLSLQAEDSIKLWERATVAKGEDKQIPTAWFKNSLRRCDWRSAQKATMALRKNFPNERLYGFWNILMCYLIHKASSDSEKDRTLFGTLAYRLISKAAQIVPANPAELLSTGKALQTPEELYLLVKIFLSTGQPREAVKVLQSDNLGLKSRFAEHDSQLVNTLLLDALEATEDWQEMSIFCRTLIVQQYREETSTFDDERVWSLLIKAVEFSNNPKLLEDAQTVVEETLQVHIQHRNAQRAKLVLLLLDNSQSAALLEGCQKYYRNFSDKSFCFRDLVSPVNGLINPDRQKFLNFLAKSTKEGKESPDLTTSVNWPAINTLKLEYCFSISPRPSQQQIGVFVRKSLQTYLRARKDDHTCPEVAVLATMALVHLARTTEQPAFRDTCLLQSVLLLQICLIHSNDYYPFLLLLVLLQAKLGLASLSMKSFKRLNIKNMQWETAGHLILTRISTFHPQACGSITPIEADDFEPLHALNVALLTNKNSGSSLDHQIQSGLKTGSYVNVIESLDLNSDLKHSINKEICAYEKIRIRRLLDLSDSEEAHIRQGNLIDKRDFSYLPNFEPPSFPPFETYIRSGPLPKRIWLDAISLYDTTYRFLKNEMAHGSLMKHETVTFISSVAQATETDVAASDEVTVTEIDNYTISLNVAFATVSMQEGGKSDPSNKGQSNDPISVIQEWLQGKMAGGSEGSHFGCSRHIIDLGDQIHVPSWDYLHWSFSVLESLRLISLLLAVLGQRSRTSKAKPFTLSKERIAKLQNLVTAVEEVVHERARALKRRLSERGVLGKLLDVALGRKDDGGEQSAIGKELEQLADEATFETCCGSWRESWEDALDGILAVKVKVYK